jgi:hypothetical protein
MTGALTFSLLSLHLWQAFDNLPLNTIGSATLRKCSRNDVRIKNVHFDHAEENHVDGRNEGDDDRR